MVVLNDNTPLPKANVIINCNDLLQEDSINIDNFFNDDLFLEKEVKEYPDYYHADYIDTLNHIKRTSIHQYYQVNYIKEIISVIAALVLLRKKFAVNNQNGMLLPRQFTVKKDPDDNKKEIRIAFWNYLDENGKVPTKDYQPLESGNTRPPIDERSKCYNSRRARYNFPPPSLLGPEYDVQKVADLPFATFKSSVSNDKPKVLLVSAIAASKHPDMTNDSKKVYIFIVNNIVDAINRLHVIKGMEDRLNQLSGYLKKIQSNKYIEEFECLVDTENGISNFVECLTKSNFGYKENWTPEGYATYKNINLSDYNSSTTIPKDVMNPPSVKDINVEDFNQFNPDIIRPPEPINLDKFTGTPEEKEKYATDYLNKIDIYSSSLTTCIKEDPAKLFMGSELTKELFYRDPDKLCTTKSCIDENNKHKSALCLNIPFENSDGTLSIIQRNVWIPKTSQGQILNMVSKFSGFIYENKKWQGLKENNPNYQNYKTLLSYLGPVVVDEYTDADFPVKNPTPPPKSAREGANEVVKGAFGSSWWKIGAGIACTVGLTILAVVVIAPIIVAAAGAAVAAGSALIAEGIAGAVGAITSGAVTEAAASGFLAGLTGVSAEGGAGASLGTAYAFLGGGTTSALGVSTIGLGPGITSTVLIGAIGLAVPNPFEISEATKDYQSESIAEAKEAQEEALLDWESYYGLTEAEGKNNQGLKIIQAHDYDTVIKERARKRKQYDPLSKRIWESTAIGGAVASVNAAIDHISKYEDDRNMSWWDGVKDPYVESYAWSTAGLFVAQIVGPIIGFKLGFGMTKFVFRGVKNTTTSLFFTKNFKGDFMEETSYSLRQKMINSDPMKEMELTMGDRLRKLAILGKPTVYADGDQFIEEHGQWEIGKRLSDLKLDIYGGIYTKFRYRKPFPVRKINTEGDGTISLDNPLIKDLQEEELKDLLKRRQMNVQNVFSRMGINSKALDPKKSEQRYSSTDASINQKVEKEMLLRLEQNRELMISKALKLIDITKDDIAEVASSYTTDYVTKPSDIIPGGVRKLPLADTLRLRKEIQIRNQVDYIISRDIERLLTSKTSILHGIDSLPRRFNIKTIKGGLKAMDVQEFSEEFQSKSDKLVQKHEFPSSEKLDFKVFLRKRQAHADIHKECFLHSLTNSDSILDGRILTRNGDLLVVRAEIDPNTWTWKAVDTTSKRFTELFNDLGQKLRSDIDKEVTDLRKETTESIREKELQFVEACKKEALKKDKTFEQYKSIYDQAESDEGGVNDMIQFWEILDSKSLNDFKNSQEYLQAVEMDDIPMQAALVQTRFKSFYEEFSNEYVEQQAYDIYNQMIAIMKTTDTHGVGLSDDMANISTLKTFKDLLEDDGEHPKFTDDKNTPSNLTTMEETSELLTDRQTFSLDRTMGNMRASENFNDESGLRLTSDDVTCVVQGLLGGPGEGCGISLEPDDQEEVSAPPVINVVNQTLPVISQSSRTIIRSLTEMTNATPVLRIRRAVKDGLHLSSEQAVKINPQELEPAILDPNIRVRFSTREGGGGGAGEWPHLAVPIFECVARVDDEYAVFQRDAEPFDGLGRMGDTRASRDPRRRPGFRQATYISDPRYSDEGTFTKPLNEGELPPTARDKVRSDGELSVVNFPKQKGKKIPMEGQDTYVLNSNTKIRSEAILSDFTGNIEEVHKTIDDPSISQQIQADNVDIMLQHGVSEEQIEVLMEKEDVQKSLRQFQLNRDYTECQVLNETLRELKEAGETEITLNNLIHRNELAGYHPRDIVTRMVDGRQVPFEDTMVSLSDEFKGIHEEITRQQKTIFRLEDELDGVNEDIRNLRTELKELKDKIDGGSASEKDQEDFELKQKTLEDLQKLSLEVTSKIEKLKEIQMEYNAKIEPVRQQLSDKVKIRVDTRRKYLLRRYLKNAYLQEGGLNEEAVAKMIIDKIKGASESEAKRMVIDYTIDTLNLSQSEFDTLRAETTTKEDIIEIMTEKLRGRNKSNLMAIARDIGVSEDDLQRPAQARAFVDSFRRDQLHRLDEDDFDLYNEMGNIVISTDSRFQVPWGEVDQFIPATKAAEAGILDEQFVSPEDSALSKGQVSGFRRAIGEGADTESDPLYYVRVKSILLSKSTPVGRAAQLDLLGNRVCIATEIERADGGMFTEVNPSTKLFSRAHRVDGQEELSSYTISDVDEQLREGQIISPDMMHNIPPDHQLFAEMAADEADLVLNGRGVQERTLSMRDVGTVPAGRFNMGKASDATNGKATVGYVDSPDGDHIHDKSVMNKVLQEGGSDGVNSALQEQSTALEADIAAVSNTDGTLVQGIGETPDPSLDRRAGGHIPGGLDLTDKADVLVNHPNGNRYTMNEISQLYIEEDKGQWRIKLKKEKQVGGGRAVDEAVLFEEGIPPDLPPEPETAFFENTGKEVGFVSRRSLVAFAQAQVELSEAQQLQALKELNIQDQLCIRRRSINPGRILRCGELDGVKVRGISIFTRGSRIPEIDSEFITGEDIQRADGGDPPAEAGGGDSTVFRSRRLAPMCHTRTFSDGLLNGEEYKLRSELSVLNNTQLKNMCRRLLDDEEIETALNEIQGSGNYETVEKQVLTDLIIENSKIGNNVLVGVADGLTLEGNMGVARFVSRKSRAQGPDGVNPTPQQYVNECIRLSTKRFSEASLADDFGGAPFDESGVARSLQAHLEPRNGGLGLRSFEDILINRDFTFEQFLKNDSLYDSVNDTWSKETNVDGFENTEIYKLMRWARKYPKNTMEYFSESDADGPQARFSFFEPNRELNYIVAKLADVNDPFWKGDPNRMNLLTKAAEMLDKDAGDDGYEEIYFSLDEEAQRLIRERLKAFIWQSEKNLKNYRCNPYTTKTRLIRSTADDGSETLEQVTSNPYLDRESHLSLLNRDLRDLYSLTFKRMPSRYDQIDALDVLKARPKKIQGGRSGRLWNVDQLDRKATRYKVIGPAEDGGTSIPDYISEYEGIEPVLVQRLESPYKSNYEVVGRVDASELQSHELDGSYTDYSRFMAEQVADETTSIIYGGFRELSSEMSWTYDPIQLASEKQKLLDLIKLKGIVVDGTVDAHLKGTPNPELAFNTLMRELNSDKYFGVARREGKSVVIDVDVTERIRTLLNINTPDSIDDLVEYLISKRQGVSGNVLLSEERSRMLTAAEEGDDSWWIDEIKNSEYIKAAFDISGEFDPETGLSKENPYYHEFEYAKKYRSSKPNLLVDLFVKINMRGGKYGRTASFAVEASRLKYMDTLLADDTQANAKATGLIRNGGLRKIDATLLSDAFLTSERTANLTRKFRSDLLNKKLEGEMLVGKAQNDLLKVQLEIEEKFPTQSEPVEDMKLESRAVLGELIDRYYDQFPYLDNVDKMKDLLKSYLREGRKKKYGPYITAFFNRLLDTAPKDWRPSRWPYASSPPVDYLLNIKEELIQRTNTEAESILIKDFVERNVNSMAAQQSLTSDKITSYKGRLEFLREQYNTSLQTQCLAFMEDEVRQAYVDSQTPKISILTDEDEQKIPQLLEDFENKVEDSLVSGDFIRYVEGQEGVELDHELSESSALRRNGPLGKLQHVRFGPLYDFTVRNHPFTDKTPVELYAEIKQMSKTELEAFINKNEDIKNRFKQSLLSRKEDGGGTIAGIKYNIPEPIFVENEDGNIEINMVEGKEFLVARAVFDELLPLYSENQGLETISGKARLFRRCNEFTRAKIQVVDAYNWLDEYLHTAVHDTTLKALESNIEKYKAEYIPVKTKLKRLKLTLATYMCSEERGVSGVELPSDPEGLLAMALDKDGRWTDKFGRPPKGWDKIPKESREPMKQAVYRCLLDLCEFRKVDDSGGASVGNPGLQRFRLIKTPWEGSNLVGLEFTYEDLLSDEILKDPKIVEEFDKLIRSETKEGGDRILTKYVEDTENKIDSDEQALQDELKLKRSQLAPSIEIAEEIKATLQPSMDFVKKYSPTNRYFEDSLPESIVYTDFNKLKEIVESGGPLTEVVYQRAAVVDAVTISNINESWARELVTNPDFMRASLTEMPSLTDLDFYQEGLIGHRERVPTPNGISSDSFGVRITGNSRYNEIHRTYFQGQYAIPMSPTRETLVQFLCDSVHQQSGRDFVGVTSRSIVRPPTPLFKIIYYNAELATVQRATFTGDNPFPMRQSDVNIPDIVESSFNNNESIILNEDMRGRGLPKEVAIKYNNSFGTSRLFNKIYDKNYTELNMSELSNDQIEGLNIPGLLFNKNGKLLKPSEILKFTTQKIVKNASGESKLWDGKIFSGAHIKKGTELINKLPDDVSDETHIVMLDSVKNIELTGKSILFGNNYYNKNNFIQTSKSSIYQEKNYIYDKLNVLDFLNRENKLNILYNASNTPHNYIKKFKISTLTRKKLKLIFNKSKSISPTIDINNSNLLKDTNTNNSYSNLDKNLFADYDPDSYKKLTKKAFTCVDNSEFNQQRKYKSLNFTLIGPVIDSYTNIPLSITSTLLNFNNIDKSMHTMLDKANKYNDNKFGDIDYNLIKDNYNNMAQLVSKVHDDIEFYSIFNNNLNELGEPYYSKLDYNLINMNRLDPIILESLMKNSNIVLKAIKELKNINESNSNYGINKNFNIGDELGKTPYIGVLNNNSPLSDENQPENSLLRDYKILNMLNWNSAETWEKITMPGLIGDMEAFKLFSLKSLPFNPSVISMFENNWDKFTTLAPFSISNTLPVLYTKNKDDIDDWYEIFKKRVDQNVTLDDVVKYNDGEMAQFIVNDQFMSGESPSIIRLMPKITQGGRYTPSETYSLIREYAKILLELNNSSNIVDEYIENFIKYIYFTPKGTNELLQYCDNYIDAYENGKTSDFFNIPMNKNILNNNLSNSKLSIYRIIYVINDIYQSIVNDDRYPTDVTINGTYIDPGIDETLTGRAQLNSSKNSDVRGCSRWDINKPRNLIDIDQIKDNLGITEWYKIFLNRNDQTVTLENIINMSNIEIIGFIGGGYIDPQYTASSTPSSLLPIIDPIRQQSSENKLIPEFIRDGSMDEIVFVIKKFARIQIELNKVDDLPEGSVKWDNVNYIWYVLYNQMLSIKNIFTEYENFLIGVDFSDKKYIASTGDPYPKKECIYQLNDRGEFILNICEQPLSASSIKMIEDNKSIQVGPDMNTYQGKVSFLNYIQNSLGLLSKSLEDKYFDNLKNKGLDLTNIKDDYKKQGGDYDTNNIINDLHSTPSEITLNKNITFYTSDIYELKENYVGSIADIKNPTFEEIIHYFKQNNFKNITNFNKKLDKNVYSSDILEDALIWFKEVYSPENFAEAPVLDMNFNLIREYTNSSSYKRKADRVKYVWDLIEERDMKLNDKWTKGGLYDSEETFIYYPGCYKNLDDIFKNYIDLDNDYKALGNIVTFGNEWYKNNPEHRDLLNDKNGNMYNKTFLESVCIRKIIYDIILNSGRNAYGLDWTILTFKSFKSMIYQEISTCLQGYDIGSKKMNNMIPLINWLDKKLNEFEETILSYNNNLLSSDDNFGFTLDTISQLPGSRDEQGSLIWTLDILFDTKGVILTYPEYDMITSLPILDDQFEDIYNSIQNVINTEESDDEPVESITTETIPGNLPIGFFNKYKNLIKQQENIAKAYRFNLSVTSVSSCSNVIDNLSDVIVCSAWKNVIEQKNNESNVSGSIDYDKLNRVLNNSREQLDILLEQMIKNDIKASMVLDAIDPYYNSIIYTDDELKSLNLDKDINDIYDIFNKYTIPKNSYNYEMDNYSSILDFFDEANKLSNVSGMYANGYYSEYLLGIKGDLFSNFTELIPQPRKYIKKENIKVNKYISNIKTEFDDVVSTYSTSGLISSSNSLVSTSNIISERLGEKIGHIQDG